MSAPADYLTEVYQKAWLLLRASGDVIDLVKLTNQIDLTDADTHPAKPSLSDADTPELALGMGAIRIASWEQDMSYFYTSDPDATNSQTLVTVEQELILTMTHEDLRIIPANQLLTTCIRALVRGGYDWGLSYVNWWGPLRANRRVAKAKSDEGRSVDRLVTQLAIPVTLEMQDSDLATIATHVTTVAPISLTRLQVTFDRPITAVAATWLQFIANDGVLGNILPVAITQATAYALFLDFPGGAQLNDGDTWSLSGTGTGITFNPSLKVPQNGTVIND